MLSISVGLAIVLWLQCILAGRNENVITKITSTYTGNLQIYRDGYLRDHLTSQVFGPLPTGWESKLPPGAMYSPRLHFPGLLSSGENSAPVSLEGVSPDMEDKITNLRGNLHEGQYLTAQSDTDCSEKQVYIGTALADLLNVKVGNKLVFLAQAPDGTLANELFRVIGTFDSHSPEFDKRFAYAPLSCVKALGNFAGLHEIAIRLPNSETESSVRESLQNFVPKDIMVSSWREALPSVASLIKFNEAVLVMISVILMSVLVLGVANTLLMNVFERTKEFGVMVALGMTPHQLRLLIAAESLIMGVMSSIGGVVLATLAVLYHQKFGFDLSPFLGKVSFAGDFYLDLIIHPIFKIVPWVKSVLIMIFVVFLAGLYPAVRASLLNPVETMRS